jgi:small subunit ribosomal protein S21
MRVNSAYTPRQLQLAFDRWTESIFSSPNGVNPVPNCPAVTIALDLSAKACNKYLSHQDEFGGVVQLAEVRLQEGESLENALRRFKRKVQQEDIIKEVKRHSFYLKPGEKKRVKEALARKRSRKKARKEAD